MKIRIKATPRKNRSALHLQLEGALEQGQSVAGNTLAKAAWDLQKSIHQARLVVTEARQTMAAGTKNFHETIEKCRAASQTASTTTADSASAGEAGANHATGLIMRGMQNLSERFAKAVPEKQSQAN